MRLWLLSNGRGEDRAAALIAQELAARRAGLDVAGASLLTGGEAFAARGVPVLVTGVAPPSGGFLSTNPLTLLRDVPSIANALSFVRRLRRLARPADRFVAVGDVFLTGLARLVFRGAGVHVALAKSVHGRRHSPLERLLLRRWARLVFARDEATAADLERHNVRAAFVGNPLVDGLACTQRSEGPDVVLLLPGSRAEAPANLVKLLEVALRVPEPSAWMCAWPDTIPVESGAQAAIAAGWSAADGRLSRAHRSVALAPGRFETMLAVADVVVGLAGSANEQAAALGKPVVTLVGSGPQTTAARMREQEKLIGGAARFAPGGPAEAAAVTTALLQAPAERRRLGCLGIARLGPPGGAARIADRVVLELGL